VEEIRSLSLLFGSEKRPKTLFLSPVILSNGLRESFIEAENLLFRSISGNLFNVYKQGVFTMSQSEIAQLRAQIADEYEAAQRGLQGLAHGTAQHKFITQRLENMERCRQRLEALAGPQETRKVMCALGQPSEGSSKPLS
jgi:hypothetical protein